MIGGGRKRTALSPARRRRLLAAGAVRAEVRASEVEPMLAGLATLRHPVFVRFRPDKSPRDCRR